MRKLLVFFHDLAVAIPAWYLTFWVRFNFDVVTPYYNTLMFKLLPFVLFSHLISILVCQTYRTLWPFVAFHDLKGLVRASLISGAALLGVLFMAGELGNVPRSIVPVYAFLLLIFLSASRFTRRFIVERKLICNDKVRKRVLIVGAGNAGAMLVKDMLSNPNSAYIPIGFLDDKQSKQGREIYGIRVLGKLSSIENIAKELDFNEIIVAIPSAKIERVREIIDRCKLPGVLVSKLPYIAELISNRIAEDLVQRIDLDELLGRRVLDIDWMKNQGHVSSKTILITGAGGSIGSEICRQFAMLSPKKIVAIDNSEFNLFKLERDIIQYPDVELQLYLSDVKDRKEISNIMELHKPDIVLHAAAYKHVPMLESRISCGVQNNILGTYNVAKSALKNGVDKFVLVSTDKAVNPGNIMGMTKRASELICQSLNGFNKTKFMSVRFGNVLGSAGSVVPIFESQIKAGGPVTVTDPEITRFFMTIPEASKLILLASIYGSGGEIFVLDMGKPIKISYLAEQMILLSGRKIEDVGIKYTGLRPGEKLHEELSYSYESLSSTQHPQIMVTKRDDSALLTPEKVDSSLQIAKSMIKSFDDEALKSWLYEFILEPTNSFKIIREVSA